MEKFTEGMDDLGSSEEEEEDEEESGMEEGEGEEDFEDASEEDKAEARASEDDGVVMTFSEVRVSDAAAFPSISLYPVSQGGLASSQSRTLTGSVGSSGLAPCHGDTVLLLVVAPRPSRFRLSIPVLGIHPLLPGFSCRLLPCNGSSSIYLKTQVKDQVSHCPHLLSLTHQLCLQNPPQTPLLLMSFTVI